MLRLGEAQPSVVLPIPAPGAPIPRSTARSWRIRRSIQPVPLGVLLLLVVLVGGPLLTVIWMSFRTGLPGRPSALTLDNFAALGNDPVFVETLTNTFVFALLTLGVSFVFLVPLTFLLTRCDLPFRRGFVALLSAGILVPTFLRAIGWIMLLSPEIGIINKALMGTFGLQEAPLSIYTMFGMSFVQGLSFVPSGFFLLAAAYQAMDPSLEEAAYASGLGKLRTFLSVNVPLTLPALLGVFIYLLMTAVSVFEAPAIIGIPARIFVISSMIALRVQPTVGLPDYGVAGAYGMIMLLIGLVLSLFYVRMVRNARRYVVVSGKGYRPRTLALGRWRPLALAFVCLFFVMELVLPLGMLVWASLTPRLMAPSLDALQQLTFANYGSMLSILNPRSILNTLALVVLVPLLAMVLSILTSWVVTRSRSPLRSVVDILAFLPHAVPSILFAVALGYLALLFRQQVPLYGTIFLIILAQGISFMAFGSRALNAAMIQIHTDLEEAGRLAGLSALGTLRQIVVPLVRMAVASSWLWIGLLAYREVTMALMLYAQSNDVLSTVIWNWWREGKNGEVAALATLLVLFLGACLIVFSVVFRRGFLNRGVTVERAI